MPQLSLRIHGLNELRIGFNRFAATIRPLTRELVKAAMERAQKRSVSFPTGGAYTPPDRPGYIRTGNLSASTYIQTDGLTTTLVSNAMRDGRPYSGYVVGNADGLGQVETHRGYWMTLRDAVDSVVEELETDIDAKLGESAEAAGF